MDNLNTQKEMILTLITNSTILKACFGYSGTIWLVSLISPQNSPMNGFIQDILNAIKDIKGNYVNGMITSDDMVEQLEDLIHDANGNDAYSGFGTTMEDDDFYKETDFTQLEV